MVPLPGITTIDQDQSQLSDEDLEFIEYLEHQYSPSRWSKTRSPDEIVQIYIDKLQKASCNFLNSTKIRHELDVRYGERDGQKLDIFFPSETTEEQSYELADTLLIFIHGGYWQECSKELLSFLGGTFAPHGMTTAVIGYDLCPKVKLDTIIEEVRESILFLKRRFPKARMFVSGTSAGGHLSAMLLAMQWENLSFDGAIIFSGLFDLRPLVKTYINNPMQMSEENAWKNSPMKYINESCTYSSCPVLCLIGDQESPESLRQTKDYCEALLKKGKNSTYLIIDGCDHFNIIEKLVDPDFQVAKEMLEFIKNAIC